jgi:hypothetical protein
MAADPSSYYSFIIKGIVSGFTSTVWYHAHASWIINYSDFTTSDNTMVGPTKEVATEASEDIITTQVDITLSDGSVLSISKDYLSVVGDTFTSDYTFNFDAISYIDANPNCGLIYEGQITDNGTETDSSGTETDNTQGNTTGTESTTNNSESSTSGSESNTSGSNSSSDKDTNTDSKDSSMDNTNTETVDTNKYIKSIKLPDGTSRDIKAPYIQDLNDGTVQFWSGTKTEYDAIETKDSNTIYNITDDTSEGAIDTSNLADIDLSNLSTTGQSILNNKADTDLSNLSEEGEKKLGGNLPLGYHFYQGEGMQPLAGFLASTGAFEDGNMYTGFWNYITEELNVGDKFAGGYVKDSTDSYDDYDLVINQSDMTFRLPLLDGSEMLPSTEIENITSIVTQTDVDYTDQTPYNCYITFEGNGTATVGYLRNQTTTEQQGAGQTTSQIYRKITIFCNKGDTFRLYVSSLSGLGGLFRIKAKGTGTLYFKVGNVIANQEAVDVSKLLDQAVLKASLKEAQVVIATYVNGTSGYRIWSDGYCEQWGYFSGSSQLTMSLLKTFADTNYTILLSFNTTSYKASYYSDFAWGSQTVNSFVVHNTAGMEGWWEAKGYLAEGEY